MTLHETLGFVRALHDWIERQVDRPGLWCWPTRELLGENLRAHRHLYGGEVISSCRTNMNTARRRGWLTEGGCARQCHARHVTLTVKGRAVLDTMDEKGCGRFHRRCKSPPLTGWIRKAA